LKANKFGGLEAKLPVGNLGRHPLQQGGLGQSLLLNVASKFMVFVTDFP